MTPAVNQLSLSPLGAGDLIDRTIRLYRRHFTTLIRAAAPPVVASALGGVMFTVGWREVSLASGGWTLALYIALVSAGFLLSWIGNFLLLLVMGGASRNLVLHLLWGEPVAARSIYQSVRARFWGLVLALLILLFFAAVVGVPLMFVWLMLVGLGAGGALAATGGSAFGVVLAVVLSLAFSLAILFAYFFIMGRVAYVPQVMLVEGRGVGEAIGRSIQLARGNVRRLTAMFLFTSFATYAVVMLLVVPLGWYGYLRGISPFQMNEAELPLWYAIGRQVLGQVAVILLAPVWMLGLSLLYVDERVRHEGYDIELLARQRLGDMPDLPDGGAAPLARAIHDAPAPHGDVSYIPQRRPATTTTRPADFSPTVPGSILGLNDERRER
ncbi:MAG: hypothetical protein QOE33_562 [Acidobacteriota bacterium]|nr:hypothetical protein [Acidobacteriota bacterium]